MIVLYNKDMTGKIIMSYRDQIKHPKWQKKRLEILQRDNWKCRCCGDEENELHVHHIYYDKIRKIWEYDNEDLVTLCNTCHTEYHRIFDNVKNVGVILRLVEIYNNWKNQQ